MGRRQPTEAGAALSRDLEGARWITAWQRGVNAGDVAEKPSKRFCVEVRGVTDVVTKPDGTREGRPINAPVYATLAMVESVILQEASEEAEAALVERLQAGETIIGFANQYRLVKGDKQ